MNIKRLTATTFSMAALPLMILVGATPASAQESLVTVRTVGSTTIQTTVYETNTTRPSLRLLGPVRLVNGQPALSVMVTCGAPGQIQVFALVSQADPSLYGSTSDLRNPVLASCSGKPQKFSLLLSAYPGGAPPLVAGPARADVQLFVSGPFAVAGSVYLNNPRFRVTGPCHSSLALGANPR
jgi:hypothetical protein